MKNGGLPNRVDQAYLHSTGNHTVCLMSLFLLYQEQIGQKEKQPDYDLLFATIMRKAGRIW
jgi:hypothetical protein